MPPKVSLDERVKQFSQSGMKRSGEIMLCSFCNKRVAWETSDGVKKHIGSRGHVESSKARKRQRTMFEAIEDAKDAKAAKVDFVTSTVEMMISTNIPLEKADHPAFKNWVKQNVVGGGDLPGSNVLRREYLPLLAKSRKQQTVAALKNKKLAVMSDETTDRMGRAIYVVLLSTVEPSNSQDQYVAAVTSLEAVNGRSCARAITEALQDMEVNFDQVVAFVSDSAKYMTSCFEGLSLLLPDDAVHIQCWAHKVNLVGVVLKDGLSALNQLVISVKQIFLHARKKRHAFQLFLQEKGSKAGLFPPPVPTRWNSWLEAVEWLADNWDILFEFLGSSVGKESFSAAASHLLNLGADESQMLHVEALFVKSLASLMKPLLVRLETNSKPIASEVYPKMRNLKRRLEVVAGGTFSNKVAEKLDALKATIRGKTLEELKKTASHMLTKVDKLMGGDPARKLLEPVAELLYRQNVITLAPTGKKLKALFNKIPSLKDISIDEGEHACKELRETLINNSEISVEDALEAMREDHQSFVDGALRALWIPVSNVNCERFFSKFSCVLTDRRTNLSITNLELLATYNYE